MNFQSLRSVLVLATTLFAAAIPTVGQTKAPSTAPSPTPEQLKSWITIRQQRVDLLRNEIKQIDSRLETRLDVIVDTLKTVSDSKDSKTKVARMKEETGKRLVKTIEYYNQKRAALKEEMRNPRLSLTAEEKRAMIAVFDERIEKRTRQVLALNKSMPPHEEHERYRTTGGGWWGTEYERNEEYDQNRRITSHSNKQRDAIVKQFDVSIARLDQQARSLKTQISQTKDTLQQQTLGEELAKTQALIAERRKQRSETLTPYGETPTHTVALKEATDLDKAIQTEGNDLRRDFTTLFQRYNTLLTELSTLHATENALAAKSR